MLLSLSIKNYALIESLEIDFSDKFSIITGETGAGKSILLGALGLVLGNRADLSSLKDKEIKCVIEAQFLVSKYNLKEVFENNDFDYEDLTIIRREILPSGKSRAFVNDSPVNLSELQNLAQYLIDIHSQHETRDLAEESYQINILDSVANLKDEVESYQSELNLLKQYKKELSKAVSEREELKKEQDYVSFLFNELEAANLEADEQIELEEELEKLNNVELIKENLDRVLAISNEEEIGVIFNLKEIKNALGRLSNFSKEYKELFERISSFLIEFQDISDECFTISEKVVSDPERLELVNTKLQTIYNLQQKHQVSTIKELLVIKDSLDEKVQQSDSIDGLISKLEKNIEEKESEVIQIAENISTKRLIVAQKVSSQIEKIITQLGMPDAKIEFAIEKDKLNNFGQDIVNLKFSANKGMQLGLIKKMASGGEMSRIMLAVKSILAQHSELPTIIFDEIDTGVSGEVALKMSEIMEKMSLNMQVFAITHLPQIAAKGNQHYKVFKYNQGETTLSELKLLSNDERIVEIAEMLSGKNISDSALIHAKNLLN
ncbi:DNA repair protein RecN [Flavobacterium okayamense]|uniref:DNA repair protein RecN n=1 Tax=Flavobacterium okayamense TaxID=2830782 RepID=A0ABM7SE85_9FLAO|nr:DNA repair protein RecN [Flavobacterium okayamense]BCY29497.1 DNA repair protein RecN [Flavobacterium okayamense]